MTMGIIYLYMSTAGREKLSKITFKIQQEKIFFQNIEQTLTA